MTESPLVAPLDRLSFRSYILRALLDWCDDEGYTPYILVKVDDACVVPREYVNADGSIVLCVSTLATHNFSLTKEVMSFETRFGERISSIEIPLGRIQALYPKENTDLASYFPLSVSKKTQKEKKSQEDIPVFTKL